MSVSVCSSGQARPLIVHAAAPRCCRALPKECLPRGGSSTGTKNAYIVIVSTGASSANISASGSGRTCFLDFFFFLGSSGAGSVISAIASVATGTGSTGTGTGTGFGAITGSMALAGAAAFLGVGTYLAIRGLRTGASFAVYMDTAKLRTADVYWYFSSILSEAEM